MFQSAKSNSNSVHNSWRSRAALMAVPYSESISDVMSEALDDAMSGGALQGTTTCEGTTRGDTTQGKSLESADPSHSATFPSTRGSTSQSRLGGQLSGIPLLDKVFDLSYTGTTTHETLQTWLALDAQTRDTRGPGDACRGFPRVTPRSEIDHNAGADALYHVLPRIDRELSNVPCLRNVLFLRP